MATIRTSSLPRIVVRCPLPRVSSRRQIFPALRSHWLPSLARTVACPAIRNIHCLYGVQCQPPTQSAANLRRFHPEARLVAETSSGGAGGANRSDWNVMVAVSMCDSPASSENTRMYSKVRRISKWLFVSDSRISFTEIERFLDVAAAKPRRSNSVKEPGFTILPRLPRRNEWQGYRLPVLHVTEPRRPRA